jgi:cell volume regulation protein A
MFEILLKNFELVIFTLSILVVLSVYASKISFTFGLPSLLLFLIIGMLAGSEGIGKIFFDDHEIAKTIGMFALVYILFSGGLDTNLTEIKPIIFDGMILSNFSVFITALILGAVVHFYFHFSLLESFLLGAIVSSTDAASVFGILKTSGIGLKGNLKPLLEFESGSNDTAAVIITLGIIDIFNNPGMEWKSALIHFVLQILIGSFMGYVLGKSLSILINWINLEQEGLYIVFTVASVYIVYGFTNFVKGNGFLAIYICGIIFGNSHFIHKRSIIMFMDGISWLMQILMFLTLGLLVFPSKLLEVIFPGILISLFLIFFARPISIFICLPTKRYTFNEKIFISWVGLRGATPIILATIPYSYNIPISDTIFNIVFFIVLISLSLQGSTINLLANLLSLTKSQKKASLYPFAYENNIGSQTKLLEFIVPYSSGVINKPLVENNFPDNTLITLICRGDEFMIPNGKITLQGGDVLLVLVSGEDAESKFIQLLSKSNLS